MAAEIRRLPAFLRLDPVLGWGGVLAGVVEDPRDGALRLAPMGAAEALPLADAAGSLGGLTLPTGVAMAPDGRVLVADPAGGRILVSPVPPCPGGPAPEGGFAPLWPAAPRPQAPEAACALPRAPAPPGPWQLIRPRGVAFTAAGDLAVADAGDEAFPGRLLIYSWPEIAPRHVAALPGGPYDIAVAPDGGLFVALPEAGRVLWLDPLWRPVGGALWRGGAGSLHRPAHLIPEAGGTLLVIDEDPLSARPRVQRLDAIGRAQLLPEADLRALWQGVYPPPFTREGAAVHRPALACGGAGAALAGVTLDRQGRLAQGPVLVPTPAQIRRRRAGGWTSAALDSGIQGFAWDRVLLDLGLPEAAAVEIATLTSETPIEPERLPDLPETRWSAARRLLSADRPEALVQSDPGRFLWLRLGLRGDGAATPALNAVEITGPRASSLELLPAPFHDDPESRRFLDRFLSYFDVIRAEIGQEIQRFPAMLSARTAPEGQFLAWLAAWFDLALLARWPDETRRRFVARADALMRARGTVAGLSEVIALHLGRAPALVEEFRLRDYAARRGPGLDDLPDWGQGDPAQPGLFLGGELIWPLPAPRSETHRFVVVLPAACVPDAQARADMERLIDLFRPAHTSWRLVLAPAGIRIGCQSTIGVDMLLAGVPQAPLGEMRLGQSARLYAPTHAPPRIGAAVLRGP